MMENEDKKNGNEIEGAKKIEDTKIAEIDKQVEEDINFLEQYFKSIDDQEQLVNYALGRTHELPGLLNNMEDEKEKKKVVKLLKEIKDGYSSQKVLLYSSLGFGASGVAGVGLGGVGLGTGAAALALFTSPFFLAGGGAFLLVAAILFTTRAVKFKIQSNSSRLQDLKAYVKECEENIRKDRKDKFAKAREATELSQEEQKGIKPLREEKDDFNFTSSSLKKFKKDFVFDEPIEQDEKTKEAEDKTIKSKLAKKEEGKEVPKVEEPKPEEEKKDDEKTGEEKKPEPKPEEEKKDDEKTGEEKKPEPKPEEEKKDDEKTGKEKKPEPKPEEPKPEEPKPEEPKPEEEKKDDEKTGKEKKPEPKPEPPKYEKKDEPKSDENKKVEKKNLTDDQKQKLTNLLECISKLKVTKKNGVLTNMSYFHTRLKEIGPENNESDESNEAANIISKEQVDNLAGAKNFFLVFAGKTKTLEGENPSKEAISLVKTAIEKAKEGSEYVGKTKYTLKTDLNEALNTLKYLYNIYPEYKDYKFPIDKVMTIKAEIEKEQPKGKEGKVMTIKAEIEKEQPKGKEGKVLDKLKEVKAWAGKVLGKFVKTTDSLFPSKTSTKKEKNTNKDEKGLD